MNESDLESDPGYQHRFVGLLFYDIGPFLFKIDLSTCRSGQVRLERLLHTDHVFPTNLSKGLTSSTFDLNESVLTGICILDFSIDSLVFYFMSWTIFVQDRHVNMSFRPFLSHWFVLFKSIIMHLKILGCLLFTHSGVWIMASLCVD